MKHWETVIIMYGKTFKNRIAYLMEKLGLIRVAYSVPVTDANGAEIGCKATVKCGKYSGWLIRHMYNVEGIVLEPFTLE